MRVFFVAVAMLLLTCLTNQAKAETTRPKLDGNDWPLGFKMKVDLQLLKAVQGGWTMTIRFSKPIERLEIWRANVISESADKTVYQLENMPWNQDFRKCEVLDMAFLCKKAKAGESVPQVEVTFKRKRGGDDNLDRSACTTTARPTTTETPTTATLPPTTRAPTTKPSTTTTKPPTTTKAPTTTVMSYPTAVPTPTNLISGETAKPFFQSPGDNWPAGFKMLMRIQLLAEVRGGWMIKLAFTEPAENLQIWRAKIVAVSSDMKTYMVENLSWNSDLAKCSLLEMYFMAEKRNGVTPSATATLYRHGQGVVNLDPNACSSSTKPPSTAGPKPTTVGPVSTAGPKPTTAEPESTTAGPKLTTAEPESTPGNPTTSQQTTKAPVTSTPTKYDYNLVLHDSILFYEAQRSGKLPATNRVPWRKDSALNDRGKNGEDLTGGWYDAGDYVKFGFPMAASVTVLAWGLVQYREAYEAAGELDYALDSIKWATDYFIKAHTKEFEFYGQVGDGNLDHAFWGRPEDMTMARPAFKITAYSPGSDLAAETAAALAVASIAFNPTNPNYASELRRHAEELYKFADKYRGKYSDSITNAAGFYRSHSGYNDELVWGAAWLYRATKNQTYLTKAKQYYNDFNMNKMPWGFSWDDKSAGVQVLLAQITGDTTYIKAVEVFLDNWLPSGSVTYTPKGLAWLDKWGSNRYAANTAFLALVAADIGIKTNTYRDFARKQIHYLLGDTGRSFVAGFGKNPPQRPHHSSSSCPPAPAPCGWNEYNSDKPNAHVLSGALVGGPDKYDNYKDDRKDYIKNEVTTDYNAGFQSAVAGLKQLYI